MLIQNLWYRVEGARFNKITYLHAESACMARLAASKMWGIPYKQTAAFLSSK
jgi:hypothetical protein